MLLKRSNGLLHTTFKILGVMAVGVLLASAASAGPITWAVNGAFDDGGAISGSFIYNADLNLYSSIDVTTTAGSTLGGAHYTLSNPCCTPLSSFLLFVTTTGDLTGTPVLSVYLDGPMTDAGGTINLAIAADKLPYFSEESCSNATCGSRQETRDMWFRATCLPILCPNPLRGFCSQVRWRRFCTSAGNAPRAAARVPKKHDQHFYIRHIEPMAAR